MTSSQSHVADNAAAYEHLKRLVNQLTDEELARPLEAGWTVAGVLAHLAFWDQRALVLLKKWMAEGISPSPMDVDIVNEAMRLHCLAIPPRAAAELALASAHDIDQAIAQLSPAMLANVETKGQTVRLNRAHHRRAHLEQIEQTLR